MIANLNDARSISTAMKNNFTLSRYALDEILGHESTAIREDVPLPLNIWNIAIPIFLGE